MADQLTGCRTGSRQTEAENGIVQTGFEQFDQVFAGSALSAGCFLESASELALEYAIGILGLLLFS